MHIKLENIIPVPLKENLQDRSSDIWNTNQVFNAGEWVKIKAPSGTGKTTLIHFLYQIRFDFEGNIYWDNINTKQTNADSVAIVRQQKLSIVFQDLKLFGNLTARENIEINRVLQQPYCASEKIDEMAARLGITSILNQKASLCSYGEQQRIAIIRALVQPFEFLLMDATSKEPSRIGEMPFSLSKERYIVFSGGNFASSNPRFSLSQLFASALK
jgi:putative ABC transport system ATP-binding protein